MGVCNFKKETPAILTECKMILGFISTLLDQDNNASLVFRCTNTISFTQSFHSLHANI